MSQTTINQLSDDIVLLIFDFLDARSLKSASKVCKNWSDLIGSSTSTMKKFKMVIKRIYYSLKEEEFKWKHHNVEISLDLVGSFNDDKYEDEMDIVNAFDFSRTRSLKFEQFSAFTMLLQQMPLLEELTFQQFNRFTDFDKLKTRHMVFPNLKTLHIYCCRQPMYVLRFIHAKNLTDLSIHIVPTQSTPTNIVLGFVKGCSKLQKLSIDSDGSKQLLDHQQDFDFKLTEFKLHKYFEISNTNRNNLTRFLIAQLPTLQSLELNCKILEPEPAFNAIFLSTCLTKISIDAASLPADDDFYRYLRPLVMLIELKIQIGGLTTKNATNNFLKICPNLKILDLEHSFIKTFNHLADHCPKLVEISIDEVKGRLDKNKKFVDLKSLKLLRIKKFSNWVSVLVGSPSIDNLEVELIDRNNKDDQYYYAFLQTPSLSRLTLGFFFSSEGSTLIFFIDHCRAFKKLRLELRGTKNGTIYCEVSKDGCKRIIMEPERYWQP